MFNRSLRNSFYNLADYSLLPLLWVVATPLFLRHLGADQYGIWALVNTIMGMGGVMAFGLTDATIKFVSQYRAKDDLTGVVRVIRGTLAMYAVLGLLAGIILFAGASFLIAHVFSVLPRNHALAIEGLQIAGIGLLVRFLDSVFLSALQGYERYDTAAKFSMAVTVATMLSNMFSVWRGQGLRVVLVTIAVFQLAGAIGKAIAIAKLTGTFRVVVPTLSLATIREISGFGLYSWIQSASSLVLGQADRLLMASFLGMRALAYYAVCLQLSQQIHAIVAKAFSFLFPLASREKEKGNMDSLASYFRRGMMLSIVMGTAAGIALFLNAFNILALWMGKDFATGAAPMLRVLALSYALMATSVVPFYYLNGGGHVRLNAILGLVSGACISLGAVFLIPWLGPVGAAWSRLCNLPTGILSRTFVYHKILDDRRWYSGLIVVLPVLASFGLAALILLRTGESAAPLQIVVLRVAASFLCGAAVAAAQCFLIFKTPVREKKYEACLVSTELT